MHIFKGCFLKASFFFSCTEPEISTLVALTQNFAVLFLKVFTECFFQQIYIIFNPKNTDFFSLAVSGTFVDFVLWRYKSDKKIYPNFIRYPFCKNL